MNTPLILIVLDGWGHSDSADANAIAQAKTPHWDHLWATRPHTLVSGSGLDVGLPNGQMGNSEVGHMTMGAGRIIYQDLTLINNALADKTFFANPVLQTAITEGNAIHILGLLSPGGVHSHEDHIFAMIRMAAINAPNKQIVVHPFLDGRDTPPQSAAASLQKLQQLCDTLSNVQIATLMGRFYAMDRDKRHERTAAACNLLTKGAADFTATNVSAALDAAYARGETDEFVQPTKITNSVISDGDAVIFMNFRSDRARQLCYALKSVVKINLVTLTEYDPGIDAKVAFPKQSLVNIFPEVIAAHNLTQLHIAETEKYAHVTFFFNAGREEPCKGEERIMIPSPQVDTYDLCPQMSAAAITAAVVEAIESKSHDVIICNYANADMVGHTGSLKATITAIETIDYCLGKIVSAITTYGGQALITADHGNAEQMWDEQSQQAHTAHTANLVPLIYVGNTKKHFLNGKFGLQDIAPTMLNLLDLQKPAEMTGSVILQ